MKSLKISWGVYEADTNRSDPEMAKVYPFLIYQRYLWFRLPTQHWHKSLDKAMAECDRLNRVSTR